MPAWGLEIITNRPRGGGLRVYSASGNLLWVVNPYSVTSLAVGDVDNDGCVEIVTVGENGYVSALDASSNNGGCRPLVGDDELAVEEGGKRVGIIEGYVKVYDVSGAVVFEGEYKDFKPKKRGVYFIRTREGRTYRKVIK